MATLRVRGPVLAAALLAALPSCGGTVGVGAPSDPPPEQGSRYPGHGFIVHEWGTDTVVVGSDGSLQRGLHHEEEDLPPFVYDRLSTLNPRGAWQASVEVKMETPVTYFYSDKELTVNASVGFPKGVFTQWYPSSIQFSPHVAQDYSTSPPTLRDPAFDPSYPFNSPGCKAEYGTIADGLLDWGAVSVLPRPSTGDPYLVDAPLDKYTWSYARQVDANPISVLGVPDENEKFLFYRGLGSFDLPVTVTAHEGGQLTLHNAFAEPIGRVFVINVQGDLGAVNVVEGGIPAGGSVDTVAPHLAGQLILDDLVTRLSDELTKTLGASGLYHDEAQAMINTWKRQWFRTPGIRLLYLIPQSWTDASIPLTILPEPDQTVRVMMIRTEVITPELEQADVAAATMLGDAQSESAGEAHFQALGRFAEPRLRRALAILGNPSYADAYLQSIATADTRGAAGE